MLAKLIRKIHTVGCSQYDVQAGYGAKRIFQTICLAWQESS